MAGERLKYWQARLAKLDAQERRVVDAIARHRCLVTNVFDNSGKAENFAYSTGLTDQLGVPEIVIYGLPGNVMHQMINRMAELAAAGVQFAAGRRYREVIEKFEVVALAVHRKHFREHFGCSLWYYGKTRFDVLQLVWPDKSGVWPWERGFAAALRGRQPLLGAPPAHSVLH